MKKKFISIAKKAMVWTMAASMLVGTPMTASARGLSDVFQVEDNYGNVIDDAKGNTATGTVTNTVTNTNSSVLQFDDQIAGIVLSETNVELETPGDAEHPSSKELEVTIVTKDGNELQSVTNAEGNTVSASVLNKKFTWKSGNTAIAAIKNPATNGDTNKMIINAKNGGRTTVTVRLDDFQNDIHYAVTANVTVKQYAKTIWFDESLKDEAYSGDSLDLNYYVRTDPAAAKETENITYAIVDGQKNATLKGSVLKLKGKAGTKATITAIGERGANCTKEIEIIASTPAKYIEFTALPDAKQTVKNNAYAWVVNDDGNVDSEKDSGLGFEAGLYSDKTKTVRSTDRITSWESKKPAIVEVKDSKDVTGEVVGSGSDQKNERSNNNRQVFLIAKSVGSTQIVGTTSGGKKATLKVTVSAHLTGLKVDVEPIDAYSGQAIELPVTQMFDDKGGTDFTDAGLKWEFVDHTDADSAVGTVTKKQMGSTAKIKNGVVTVNADLKGVKVLELKVSNAKNISKKGDTYYKDKNKIVGTKDGKKDSTAEQHIVINLKQVNIKEITVYQNAALNSKPLASNVMNNDGKFAPNPAKGADVTIAVDGKRTYRVKAMGTVEGQEGDVDLSDAVSWASSSVKVATVKRNSNGSGSVAAINKGKSTITVSGSSQNPKNNKYTTMKVTIKATVTQPTKNITLSTKTTAIPLTNGKSPSVSVKAVLDKGTTTKASAIKWTVSRVAANSTDSYTNHPIANGKFTINNSKAETPDKNGFYPTLKGEVGDKFIVKATIAEAGLSTSMTLNVVAKSTKATMELKAEGSDQSIIDKNKATLHLGTIYDLKTLVNDGNGTAKVSYTVSKPGYVFIVGDKMTPVAEGTGIKITPVTADGKKGTAITVNIESGSSN